MLLHVDFFVSSIENSLKFYVDKLGMEVIEDTIVEGELVKFVSNGRFNTYRLVLLKISSQGAMIELMQYLDESGDVHPEIIPHRGSTTILVKSIDKIVEKLKLKGILPSSDIFFVSSEKLGKSKIIFYKDPDGHIIEFLQVLPG